MKTEIGKSYLETLEMNHLLIRQALGGHKLRDSSMYILREGNSLVLVHPSNRGVCYECQEVIEKEGLELIICISLGNSLRSSSTFYFHMHHFE